MGIQKNNCCCCWWWWSNMSRLYAWRWAPMPGGILPKKCDGVCAHFRRRLPYLWLNCAITKKLPLKKKSRLECKNYTLFMTKKAEDPTRWCCTYLYTYPRPPMLVYVSMFSWCHKFSKKKLITMSSVALEHSDRFWLSLVTRLKCGFSWTRSLTFRATLRVAKV